MVVHSGVDGYSRSIVYLQCSINNCVTTALSAFRAAVHKHGIPSHVRSDLGGEIVDVWSFISQQHGSDSAVITGSSTHNEQIERHWQDYFRSVGSLFHDTFQALEANNKLDPLNEVDIFCLHYVSLSRITSAIDTFIESWNNHRISTAGNVTPNQLFVQGAIAHDRFPQYPVVPSSHFTSPLPHGNVAVALARCSFCPCSGLLHYLLTYYSFPKILDVLCT